MSGPKKADVQAKLTRALALTRQFAQQKRENTQQFQESASGHINQARTKAQGVISGGNVPAEATNAFAAAEQCVAVAERLRAESAQRHQEAETKMQEAQQRAQAIEDAIRDRSSHGSFYAEDRNAIACVNLANDAERIERQSVELLQKSAEEARKARTHFESVTIIVAQKKEEERQRALRHNAVSLEIQSVRDLAENFGLDVLAQWSDDATGLADAKRLLEEAAQRLAAESFDGASSSASRAAVLYRQLYDKAVENQKRVESRNIIAKAIRDALIELEYDAPDMRYVRPSDAGEGVNTKLGMLTIFAKSPGNTGDMRLKIDLNGKVDLEVTNIPEGLETECHQRITDLQTKTEGTIDLKVTDWGRAANVAAQEPSAKQSLGSKVKVKEKEVVKEKQRAGSTSHKSDNTGTPR